ncbi:hypothetical protein CAI21_18250 [Alkalilimnicola ehrlichii]|uniref:HTH cro/C1-type domain-containing protein n=1 Tax=Alkalilimnicola ehrlichii TaxID=351052 RepID=A0A3E0WRS6_9GAMM|nr:helix-turn-helix transcriptional regulator [Alkalilimnicola ehrlichii]RFA25799.1 hypothetical protein CAI21_18250 [Alkalilimnicola ehrlichii]RFA35099.1 hypothetical protein CAL65_13390 [Alkalilimnicola ehrlichii]
MSVNDIDSMSDEAVLQLLGERLARYRLNRNQTQANLAHEAGLARRTVSKVENGHVIDSRCLVRLLRALGLLDRLDLLVPESPVSPLALVEARGRVRERARGYDREGDAGEGNKGAWTWPDEDS